MYLPFACSGQGVSKRGGERLALALTECQGGHTRNVMPTYEYACRACGHEWEQSQRITEEPVLVCPKCAASAAHRLISAGTNFILKGGGWYSDLYATPKAAAKSAEEKPSGEKSESKPGDKKSEASGAASGGGGATDTASKPAAKAGATEAAKPSTAPSSTPST